MHNFLKIMISIIACIAKENRAIGYHNQLLYHIKEDMARFKKLTTGHTIIMGRKTYESLPHGALPYRRNVVISQKFKEIADCKVYSSFTKALERENTGDVFIIGGESIYRQALPLADKLYLTVVEGEIKYENSHKGVEGGKMEVAYGKKADAFFPPIHLDEWEEIEKETRNENGITFSFLTYIRK